MSRWSMVTLALGLAACGGGAPIARAPTARAGAGDEVTARWVDDDDAALGEAPPDPSPTPGATPR